MPVGSEDVNDYLKTITGEPFTAKDFRTWAGTVLVAIALTKMEQVSSKAMAKRHVTTAINAVAQILGNTPAVCRKCYVHPVITARYMAGTFAHSLRIRSNAKSAKRLRNLKPEEAAVFATLCQG